MSTKALREVLDAIRWDGRGGTETAQYKTAMAELDAIEKAADIVVWWGMRPPDPLVATTEEAANWKKARGLLERIATESKRRQG